MKHMLSFAVAAAALLAFSPLGVSLAHADDNWRSGLYIKGGAGWNHTQDQDMSGSTNVELDEGYDVSAAVGYDYGAWRSELEVTYRDNNVDSIDTAGTALPDAGGDVRSTAFMLNGYYDLPVNASFTPYIGAGIGVAKVKEDADSAGTAIADDDDTVFAYQGMIGAEFAVADNVDFYTEYKYFATDDVDVGSGNDTDYQNHSVMAGVKYSFH